MYNFKSDFHGQRKLSKKFPMPKNIPSITDAYNNNNDKIVINFAKSLPLSPLQSCSLSTAAGFHLCVDNRAGARNAARCFRKWIAWAQVVWTPLLPVVRAHPESNYGRMSKFRPRSYLTPRLVFASFTIFLLFSLEAERHRRFRFLFPRRGVPVLRRDSHLSVSLLPPYRPLPLSSSSLRIVFFSAILVWAVVGSIATGWSTRWLHWNVSNEVAVVPIPPPSLPFILVCVILETVPAS